MPRQLPNATHAHPRPQLAFSTKPCDLVHYGVLVGVSTGYPPVAGRLHTRYAPVRRSPAAHCWAPLPLDLHVLSLPLAFILSQDQTLHCKNCLLLPLTRLVSPPPGLARRTPTHAISSSQLFQCPFAFREPRFFTAAPLSKAGAKIQPFSKTPKFFFAFSGTFFAHSFEPARYGRNFFSEIPENRPVSHRKKRKNLSFFPKIGTT